MKSYIAKIQSIALSSCLLCCSQIIFADNIELSPSSTEINITCPVSTPGEVNTITNFGDYIAGYGTEELLSQSKQIYFVSENISPKTPIMLADYYNDSMVYNSANGRIYCYFRSIVPTDPMFSLFYQLTNGQGGTILSQTSGTISILMPIG